MTVNPEPIGTQSPPESPPKHRKAYKGLAMEGWIARWYSKNQAKSLEQYRSWAKMASTHISEGARVLEVAPGPGYLSIELGKLERNYNITGLDVSKTFVEIASEKAREAGVKQLVQFRQGDAAYMPLSDNSFDFIICTSAFKNFPEPVKVIDEMFRVLKGGGEAVIIDLRKDASIEAIDRYVDEMNLSWSDSLMTKFIFKHSLVKSAHAKSEFEDFAARSKFGKCEIVEELLGLEVWFKKRV